MTDIDTVDYMVGTFAQILDNSIRLLESYKALRAVEIHKKIIPFEMQPQESDTLRLSSDAHYPGIVLHLSKQSTGLVKKVIEDNKHGVLN